MQIPHFLHSYFLAENFPQERRWSVGMARVFTWCAIGGFTSQAAAALFILQRYELVAMAAICVGVMFIAIKLNDSGKVKPARILRMIVALIFFYFMTAKTGGLASPSFFWAGVFILGSMFSFGTASAVPVSIALAAMASFYHFQKNDGFILFQYLTSLLFIYALSYLFDQLSKYFIRLSEQQKEKAIAAQALAEASQKNTVSILESINEGILSILPEGKIDTIPSPYFVRILETDQYMGRSLKEALLDRLHHSSDERDQCWQTVLSSIGEDALNFEINEKLLITETQIKIGHSTKFLRLKWSPVVQGDIVSKITLAVEDVTALRQQEAELAQRRIELNLIGQLLEISEEKARAFFLSAQRLLQENLSILQKPMLTHNDIRVLFVNAHTVKGAARTLGFTELTPMIHDAEENYQKILKMGLPIDSDLLLQQHQSLAVMFDNYSRVNFEKLRRNREANQQSLQIERSFIEQHYNVLYETIASSNHNNWTMDEILSIIHRQNRELASRIFDLLPSVLGGYDEMMGRVAQTLHKPKPRLVLDVPDTIIHTELKNVLDNSMTHVIRNTLDHGIEMPEVRLKKHKTPEGVVTISATQEGAFLRLTISDDGQGLAIPKLREKGLAAGLLAGNNTLQDIAELVFVSGMSTATEVSDISGRGVGMDAVRRFLESIGGSISIELLGPLENENQKFQLVLALPLKDLPSPGQSSNTIQTRAG